MVCLSLHVNLNLSSWNLFLLTLILSLNFAAFFADRPVSSFLDKHLLPPSVWLPQHSLGRSFAWGEALHKPLWSLCLWLTMLKALHLQADTEVELEKSCLLSPLWAVVCTRSRLIGRRTTKPVGCQVFRVSSHVFIVFFFTPSSRYTGCSRPQGAARCALLTPLLSSVSPVGTNIVVRCLQSGIVNGLVRTEHACWLSRDGTRCGFSTSNQRRMEMSKNGCVLRHLSVVASWFLGRGVEMWFSSLWFWKG